MKISKFTLSKFINNNVKKIFSSESWRGYTYLPENIFIYYFQMNISKRNKTSTPIKSLDPFCCFVIFINSLSDNIYRKKDNWYAILL